MKFEMYGTSMINGGKSDIQSTPDNSTFKRNRKKFELLGVRVIEGKIM